ncbi:hypothetical protein ZHAS_00003180 [Anopheles sinensis]|uniref:Uncharacterized protein n=1 Tax=Anopheles sinensis TaxID=74873 RepID=A0A084VDT7_ANOSI|nr:hypothetical protein ZHAS_00003180 [Anopheles sinensis]
MAECIYCSSFVVHLETPERNSTSVSPNSNSASKVQTQRKHDSYPKPAPNGLPPKHVSSTEPVALLIFICGSVGNGRDDEGGR